MSLLVSTRETLRSAFLSLWSHKLRSGLTTLGIVIGVASVITVVQLMKGLEARIMEDVNREGSRTFMLTPWVPTSVWKKGQKIRFQPMTRDVVAELRELVPEIRVASPEYFIWGRHLLMKVGRNQRRVFIHAMDEHGLELAGLELAAGRGFTPVDRNIHAPVVILGALIAQEMELTEANLGQTFTIAGQTAELIGILKKVGDIPFMPQNDEDQVGGTDNEVICPVGSFKPLTNPWNLNQMSWRLQVDDKLQVQAAEDLIKLNLRRVRGLRGDDPDNFELNTNRKQVEMMEKLTRTLLLASAAMVSISLLVGGVGVMNIMLVSVTERTREIGLRKALGARRRAILLQFLVEAIVLCLAGGLLGIGLGFAVGTTLSQWLMHHLGSIPAWALASSIAVPALVGLIFGFYPARRAAGLDPIESLRYE
jgi:putative ABC transport system permease protein